MSSSEDELHERAAVVRSVPPGQLLDPRRLPPPTSVGPVNAVNSKFVIGTKITNITVDNREKVKVNLIGLDLVSEVDRRKRAVRCGFAVCACWTLLIIIGILIYVLYAIVVIAPTLIDVGLNETWYLRRDDWQAAEPNRVVYMNLPVRLVVVGHTVTGYCNQTRTCIDSVRAIQKAHIIEKRWPDIGYNFMVGGGGIVLEGRGANLVGAHLAGWNSKSIGVAFLGNYSGQSVPDDKQFHNLEILLERLVELQVLSTDYKVVGVCQLTGDISPGRRVARRLMELTHWDSMGFVKCE